MARRPYDQARRRGVNISLNPELWKELKVSAIRQNIPVYVALEQAIRDYLAQSKTGLPTEAEMADLLPTV